MNDLNATQAKTLSTTEQLNKMIVIAPPSCWIAVIAGFLITVCVICWSMAGELPVTIEADGILLMQGAKLRAYCYVPIAEGQKIQQGMEAVIVPYSVDEKECGHMAGVVEEVFVYAASEEELGVRLGSKELAEVFLKDGPVVEVICSLQEDEGTQSGFSWSNEKGEEASLAEGLLFEADIVTERKKPIAMIFP